MSSDQATLAPPTTPESAAPPRRKGRPPRPRPQVRMAEALPPAEPVTVVPPPAAAVPLDVNLGLDPWDASAPPVGAPQYDQANVDELAAALQGRGPRVIDHTPPPPVPQSLREMWEYVLGLEERVKGWMAAGGGVFGSSVDPVPTLVLCNLCKEGENIHELLWPPDPLKGLMCPTPHSEVSMLTPLTALESEVYRAGQRAKAD